jgi:hypothetical protein
MQYLSAGHFFSTTADFRSISEVVIIEALHRTPQGDASRVLSAPAQSCTVSHPAAMTDSVSVM